MDHHAFHFNGSFVLDHFLPLLTFRDLLEIHSTGTGCRDGGDPVLDAVVVAHLVCCVVWGWGGWWLVVGEKREVLLVVCCGRSERVCGWIGCLGKLCGRVKQVGRGLVNLWEVFWN